MNQKQKRQNKKRRQQGFTLVEVLIVLAIITMLGTYVGLNVMGKFKNAQKDGAKLQIAGFQQALQAYYLDNSIYPNTAQGLAALISKPSSGKVPKNFADGGYLKDKKIPKDPWGNDYKYSCDDHQNYSISSDGPDGNSGTDDDIKSGE